MVLAAGVLSCFLLKSISIILCSYCYDKHSEDELFLNLQKINFIKKNLPNVQLHYSNFKIKIITLLKFNMCITTHRYCFFNHENIFIVPQKIQWICCQFSNRGWSLIKYQVKVYLTLHYGNTRIIFINT